MTKKHYTVQIYRYLYMNEIIETLHHQQLVWHGASKTPVLNHFSSGYKELDEKLDGGFPETGVIEIISDMAIGELRLLLPSISQQESKRLITFIAPPGDINAAMMYSNGVEANRLLVITPKDQQEALWAAEQCLKSGACDSVLLWLIQPLEIHQVKRLQLASEQGHARQFVFKNHHQNELSLPVDLSLSLSACDTGLTVKINKRKRGWPCQPFVVDMQKYWPKLTQRTNQTNTLPDNVVAFSTLHKTG